MRILNALLLSLICVFLGPVACDKLVKIPANGIQPQQKMHELPKPKVQSGDNRTGGDGNPTPSPTPSATPSPTPSATPSPTPSATPSPTPSATPSPTPSATPAPSPQLSLSGSGQFGGPLFLGSLSNKNFVLSNAAGSGVGSASGLTAGVTTNQFAVTGSDCPAVIPPGTSCLLQVAFQPLSPGVKPDVVQIKNSSGAILTSAVLQGEGGHSTFDDIHYAGNQGNNFGRGLLMSVLTRAHSLNPTVSGRHLASNNKDRLSFVGFRQPADTAVGSFRISDYGLQGISPVTTGTTTAVIGVSEFFLASAISPEGNMLAAGFVFDATKSKIRLVLRGSNGAPVPTFGTNGVVTLDPSPTHNVATGVTFDTSGKILVVGNIENAEGNFDGFVARFTANGLLDTSFSGDGMHTFSFGKGNDYATHISLNDNIVVGGRGFVAAVLDDQGFKAGYTVLAQDGSVVVPPRTFGIAGRHQSIQTMFADSTSIFASIRLRAGDGAISNLFVKASIPTSQGNLQTESVSSSFATGVSVSQIFGSVQRPDGSTILGAELLQNGLSLISFLQIGPDGSIQRQLGEGFCSVSYTFSSSLATGSAVQAGTNFVLTITNLGFLSDTLDQMTLILKNFATGGGCDMTIGGI